MLTGADRQRLAILSRVVSGSLRGVDAAAELGLSVRQLRRILAAYRAEGAAAIPHRNRGRKPGHTTARAIRDRVGELCQTLYASLNDSQLRDVLEEREGIVLSRSTVRRLRRAIGQPSPCRRRERRHDVSGSTQPSFPAAAG